MNEPVEDRTPKTQLALSGRPPDPPKFTARDVEGRPGGSGRTVYLLDPMVVRDVAIALELKPFKVIADLIGLGQFKHADEEIDFETAAIVARKHGYRPQRPPPGVLVL
jgi:hypothetical protein